MGHDAYAPSLFVFSPQSKQYMMTGQLADATKSGKQVVSSPNGQISITVEKAKSIVPSEVWEKLTDGRSADKWILLMEHGREMQPASSDARIVERVSNTPLLFDAKTGEVSPLNLKPETYKSLLNQLPKLKNEAEKK